MLAWNDDTLTFGHTRFVVAQGIEVIVAKLVIVESPAKGRTISAFLGPEYVVEASIGHVRDLPQPSDLPADMKKGPYGKFAVNVEGNFEPYYAVAHDKKKKVAELKKLLKNSSELLLATDEDREGEAIAWHLREVLKPHVPVKRMVFHEITPEAISRALDHPRDVNEQLVDAQESRRIIDRLVGYEVSPLLWRKVSPGLSAGRVQSVATRLVVEREKERMAFVPAQYWDVNLELARGEDLFPARLVSVEGMRVASGKDFDDSGALVKKAFVLDATSGPALAADLLTTHPRVASVESKPYRRRPAPPFTTSTLQQEAGRKLRMGAREAMRVAQSLYENGYITYMRTDSTNLSEQAISAARTLITREYGAEYVPEKPRVYATTSKGAQEAHEAIRPAGEFFRTPAQVSNALNSAQLALYELIYRRTIASQMKDAQGHTDSMKLNVEKAGDFSDVVMSATGTVITFAGFMAAYQESSDQQRYTQVQDESRLPHLEVHEVVDVQKVEPQSHQTQPKPRYTEASLVKKMEELGIGRPSTYAATISTITDRGYVQHKGQALVPTWTAFGVINLLEKNLPELVDYDFTAHMENELDKIAAGELSRVDYLRHFWKGENTHAGLEGTVEALGDIDARAVNTIPIGGDISVRIGRYGPFIQEIKADGTERTAPVPADMAPDELTEEKAQELLDAHTQNGRELGIDPVSGHMIVVKNGRFGPYFTEIIPDDEVLLTKTGKPSKKKPKPRTASLFASMDPDNVSLDEALKLLTLPREVGELEGEMVYARNGRYGPYITHGTNTRSLENEEQIFSISLEEAKALLEAPRVRRQAVAKPPMKEFGVDPVSGKPVVLKDGRFGPYVTDGVTNASLRSMDDPLTITNERAYELLQMRREAPPTTRGRKKAASKKTSTAKKSGSTKKAATARKTTAQKKSARTKAQEENGERS